MNSLQKTRTIPHRALQQAPDNRKRTPMLRAALWWLALLVGLSSFGAAAMAQPQEVATATTTVNINAADAATLAASLKGVGEARAKEIVRHRETFGPFASPQELLEVKGVGQSTLEMNRHLITLE
jgi:competence protein ComEA